MNVVRHLDINIANSNIRINYLQKQLLEAKERNKQLRQQKFIR